MKVSILRKVSRQVASGLYELLRTNAANIHTSEDWCTLFTLLECVGAGTHPPAMIRVDLQEPKEDHEHPLDSGLVLGLWLLLLVNKIPVFWVLFHIERQSCLCTVTASVVYDVPASQTLNGPLLGQSDSELSIDSQESKETDHGYTSDSELYKNRHAHSGNESDASTNSGSWLVVNKDGKSAIPENQFEIALSSKITFHDSKALKKCCESLAFLVRDAAHVTPSNFEACIHAIRTFVEATVNGGKVSHEQRKQHTGKDRKGKKGQHKTKGKMTKAKTVPSDISSMVDWLEDEDVPPGGYQSLSIQLLDLMHTLHTRAASIFSSWAEEEKEKEGIVR
ncbi:putative golgi-specific brefeldin A-resistance guanine nucleotide exchange factor 1 isoform X2 [Apostichopus japonicus]|uniref:Putative golgi-specific brefeldin A-resistance guanine nucleotide exchange factor 1 isoform X2 n=1 Tax=Stichopus japonicus TaxID=307972 RepID=A0A2G8KD62_STIJA|nr:putative golgi-specific brefeldin A-resistance guanine nucleotide exchange factor 1 isoform X2 [Apostichopus japonicus]